MEEAAHHYVVARAVEDQRQVVFPSVEHHRRTRVRRIGCGEIQRVGGVRVLVSAAADYVRYLLAHETAGSRLGDAPGESVVGGLFRQPFPGGDVGDEVRHGVSAVVLLCESAHAPRGLGVEVDGPGRSAHGH